MIRTILCPAKFSFTVNNFAAAKPLVIFQLYHTFICPDDIIKNYPEAYRGVLRVLEHPHQIEESKLYLIEQLAREEATHTATDL